MTDDEVLLRAYDEQLRGFANAGRPGITIEQAGPVLRVAGSYRGFVTWPPNRCCRPASRYVRSRRRPT